MQKTCLFAIVDLITRGPLAVAKTQDVIFKTSGHSYTNIYNVMKLLNKDQLENLAQKMAERELKRRNWKESDPLYDLLYITGAVYFYF